MKLNGFVGKGSGKLGASVFAISGGEQIVRQYNPVVSNPQTDAQVEQRAKLKLMSQLAAAMSRQIAFKKDGLVSARNQFVSANIKKVTYDAATGARVELTELELAGGAVVLPAITVVSLSGTPNIVCEGAADMGVNRVIYNIFRITEDEKVVPVATQAVEKSAQNSDFHLPIPEGVSDCFVLAYGVLDKTTKASTKFNDYAAQEGATGANDYAVLDVLRSLNTSDYALTSTSGLSLE